MYFTATTEHAMLRDSARSYLAEKAPVTRVREVMEGTDGFDRVVWNDIAGMGWQSMAIPEVYGGAGFSVLEQGVLMEEMGRALTPIPFLSAVVLGANAVLIAGSEEQRETYLPTIASGRQLIAVAIAEPGGGWSTDDVALSAEDSTEGWRLSGKKAYVVDGQTANLLVVAARTSTGAVDLFVVDAEAAGVSIRPVGTMDLTRKLATIDFEDVGVVERLGNPDSGAAAVESLYDIAAVMLAYEQVGGAQRCLEMSVQYAKDRVQFGRPIGSFQAIKHKCADMLVEVEAARSAAMYAGWTLSNQDDDLPIAAALAKARCSEAFFSVAAETIQVHGGVGFTWEHDAHLFFKRAKADQLLFGAPSAWRAKLADRIGL